MSKTRFCVALMLAAVMGCGGNGIKLPKADVTGIVTYEGKPLDSGRIQFIHLQSGQGVQTTIASDGTFKVDAFQGNNEISIVCLAGDQPVANSEAAPGLPTGARASAATASSPSRRSKGTIGYPPRESLIPPRYSESSTSGLKLDVKSGENKADFALKD